MIWIEGDNPVVSRDSNSYGPVPISNYRGYVSHVIWPKPHALPPYEPNPRVYPGFLTLWNADHHKNNDD